CLARRGQLRPAAQARPVARPLALRRVAEEQAVVRLRHPPRAHGPAVDPRGLHGDEEAPVEARIPRPEHPQATVAVEGLARVHGFPGVEPDASASRRKSTTSVRVTSGASRWGLCRLPRISRTMPRRTPRPM